MTHDRKGLGRVTRILDDISVIVDFGHESSLLAVPHRTLTKL